jgi:hypothetical protein
MGDTPPLASRVKLLALANTGAGLSTHLLSFAPEEWEALMRRMLLLMTLGAMMAALMMTLSGVALAQGGADVCVSIKGEEKVDKGGSTCSSEDASKAVAVNSSDAIALNDATAVALNDSYALGVIDCTIVTTQPGDFDACVF